MQQMPRLWESADPASCRGRKSSVLFFTLLPCHFSLFFFQLGQSCCGPWCRVPRARRWNSNMDHLTPVKTALLVERQALSACRGKCYAASQFSPASPLVSLSLPLPCFSLSPTLANSPSASLSLSLLNLSLILSLLLPIYLYFSFSHISLLLWHSLSFSLDIFTLQIFMLNSEFLLISPSFQMICTRIQATCDTNMNRHWSSHICFFNFISLKHILIIICLFLCSVQRLALSSCSGCQNYYYTLKWMM